MTNSPSTTSAHTFHIPVMGTGFTLDTPAKVAHLGITSVISLVDDILVEQMRKYHCLAAGEPYEPIADDAPDSRARRITEYLNLLGRLVSAKSRHLQAQPFVPGSEITRYFELLPESPAKELYVQMCATPEGDGKQALQEQLRALAVPGGIDVNIMTKLDYDSSRGREPAVPESNDAMAALRGFALSDLSSAVVFSAGLNRPLYSYAARFPDFFPVNGQLPRKRIILKVSDYRSAIIQGAFFAKHGLWLSEFRVESGLNCGGHAFATKGYLMGPILNEFKMNRNSLEKELRDTYMEALRRLNLASPSEQDLNIRITAQGGIGTAEEDRFLRRHYGVEGTGWGTPFLLVPEVVNVDSDSLAKLVAASHAEVELSDNSPLGVQFWNLRTSASEVARRQRISDGVPGSACRNSHVLSNTEVTERAVCPSSRAYQSRKLELLRAAGATEEAIAKVVIKACICHDLGGSAALGIGSDPAATPAVCCGPNIAWFNRVASLDEMVGHIYGRLSLLANSDRPHMFINELQLYVNELRRQAAASSQEASERMRIYVRDFHANLLKGIEHYRLDTARFLEEKKACFLADLEALEVEVRGLGIAAPTPA